MVEWTAVLRFAHLLSTVYMAAPLYMLLVVNERARFGGPIGYSTDRYMENIIKNHARRCFVVLGTVLASGLLLVWADGISLSEAVANWTLWVKLGAALVLFGLLSYIHFYLQPQIEELIARLQPDQPAPAGLGPQVAMLRVRRKRISSVCLFTVLTAVVGGVRMLVPYPLWLFLVFEAVVLLFTYRTFRAPLPYGWF
ncbi:MAG: hypothetical protein HY685_02140 [Chloroflexi bacterium]|nr:hypothetical protein [Chloroflexota bacterium]